jgi:hypothetical protein
MAAPEVCGVDAPAHDRLEVADRSGSEAGDVNVRAFIAYDVAKSNERLKATEGRACFQTPAYAEVSRGSPALAPALGALA